MKERIEYIIKYVIKKVNKGYKIVMPYMSLIAVLLCIINFFFLLKLQFDIEDVHHSITNISTDYDNSDVINAIEDAESNIISSIEDAESNIISSVEDAESNLRSNLIIWGN